MTDTSTCLLALLDAERDALMAGNYDDLEGFAAQKLAFVEALRPHPPREPLARRIRDRINRNEALMRSASDGFRAVIQALSARQAAARTTLYHPDGSAQIMPNSARTVERKA